MANIYALFQVLIPIIGVAYAVFRYIAAIAAALVLMALLASAAKVLHSLCKPYVLYAMSAKYRKRVKRYRILTLGRTFRHNYIFNKLGVSPLKKLGLYTAIGKRAKAEGGDSYLR